MTDITDTTTTTPTNNLAHQNWLGFANETKDWYGTWTRYFLKSGKIESYQSIRTLNPDPDGIQFHQINTRHPGTKEHEEHISTMSEAENGLSDGIYHPLAPTMRGYQLPRGSAWCSTMVEASCGMEIYFHTGNIRISVVILYDEESNLWCLHNIPEEAGDAIGTYWSDKNELESTRSIPTGVGTLSSINAKLERASEKRAEFKIDVAGRKVFHLPDGVSILTPQNYFSDMNATAIWLIDDKRMLVNNVFYTDGKFSRMVVGEYEQTGNHLII